MAKRIRAKFRTHLGRNQTPAKYEKMRLTLLLNLILILSKFSPTYAGVSAQLFSKRLEAFEFCESTYISEKLRGRVFDALSKTQKTAGVDSVTDHIFTHLVPRRIQPGARILEIGSGSGTMLAKVAAKTRNYKFVLTDLFPQKSWLNLKSENLDFIEESVDFGKDKEVLIRHLRPGDALFLSATLHHFKPELVLKMLDLIGETQTTAFVLEPMARDLRGVSTGLGSGLLGLLSSRAAWRDPRVPFILSFDGVVSALRQYRSQDLMALSNNRVQIEELKGLGRFGNFRIMIIEPTEP